MFRAFAVSILAVALLGIGLVGSAQAAQGFDFRTPKAGNGQVRAFGSVAFQGNRATIRDNVADICPRDGYEAKLDIVLHGSRTKRVGSSFNGNGCTGPHGTFTITVGVPQLRDVQFILSEYREGPKGTQSRDTVNRTVARRR